MVPAGVRLELQERPGATGGGGGDGAPATNRSDAPGAVAFGSISASAGWVPTSGSSGLNGQPGQGGGGGTGASLAANVGGGGGGGCGGCGGKGAPAATGGGASIASARARSPTFRSDASIDNRNRATQAREVQALPVELGQTWRTLEGTATGSGCLGRQSAAMGAAGAASGGGAGGISVGIVSQGGSVTADDVTFTLGSPRRRRPRRRLEQRRDPRHEHKHPSTVAVRSPLGCSASRVAHPRFCWQK